LISEAKVVLKGREELRIQINGTFNDINIDDRSKQQNKSKFIPDLH
jgi:hypothetical protein